MIMRWRQLLGLLMVLFLVATACGDDDDLAATTTQAVSEDDAAAADDDSSPPYPGIFSDRDTIILILGSSAGGGFDRNARMMASYLEPVLRDLTGSDVRVVVQNLTGAGMQVAFEAIYRAEPDGFTVGLFAVEVAAAHQVLREASYDITELTWLGHYARNSKAVMVRRDLDLAERTFQGLIDRSQTEPILWGSAGNQTDFRIMKALLAETGTELLTDDVVFDGIPEEVASMLRGEIEAFWTNESTIVRFANENDELEVLVSTACERTAAAPDVPNIVEQGLPKADEICSLSDPLRRTFAAPPGMAEDVAALLEEAFRLAITDPQHIAEAAEAGFALNYQPPEVNAADAVQILDTYRRFQALLEG